MSAKTGVRQGVDAELNAVADVNAAKLGFAKIGFDPKAARGCHGHEPRPCRYIFAEAYIARGYSPFARSQDLGAAKVGAGADEPRVGALEQSRSEEHTSELQSLMRISYADFCMKKKKTQRTART